MFTLAQFILIINIGYYAKIFYVKIQKPFSNQMFKTRNFNSGNYYTITPFFPKVPNTYKLFKVN